MSQKTFPSLECSAPPGSSTHEPPRALSDRPSAPGPAACPRPVPCVPPRLALELDQLRVLTFPPASSRPGEVVVRGAETPLSPSHVLAFLRSRLTPGLVWEGEGPLP